MRDVSLQTLFAPEETEYDYVITNPPKELCRKDSPEAGCLPEILAGGIDLSFLFSALSTCVLRDGGQLIALLPSTVATATSLSKYRRYMAGVAAVERVHLFLNRARSEKQTDSLRKNLVIKYVKGSNKPEHVRISTCHGDEVSDDVRILPPLPYDFVVRGECGSLLLPKSRKELDILYLLPIALSVLMGVFVVVKVMDKAMKRFTKQTFLIIIGFVAASAADIIIESVLPLMGGLLSVIAAILPAIVGFLAIFLISRKEEGLS
jgi:hypothetical protein